MKKYLAKVPSCHVIVEWKWVHVLVFFGGTVEWRNMALKNKTPKQSYYITLSFKLYIILK